MCPPETGGLYIGKDGHHLHPVPLQRVSLLARHLKQEYDCPQSGVEDIQGSIVVVLVTGPNSRFHSGYRSNPELDHCTWFCHTKTWTIAIGSVLPPETRHFNLTTFAPIKYQNPDRIMT
jgi:hypothetical protein